MDTREKIVQTACRLFYTQGYTSTGVNQIIAEAKVAKASLYQYFPSKEDLLVEYLRAAAEQTNNSLANAIDKEKKVKDKVMSIFDFLSRQTKAADFNGCNFLNIVSEIPKSKKGIRKIIQKEKDHIRKLFGDILKPAGKESLADELYVLFDGALVSSKVYDDGWPIKVTRRIVDKLL